MSPASGLRSPCRGDGRRQASHCRRIEELWQGELDAESGAHPIHHLGGAQRVAARSKKLASTSTCCRFRISAQIAARRSSMESGCRATWPPRNRMEPGGRGDRSCRWVCAAEPRAGRDGQGPCSQANGSGGGRRGSGATDPALQWVAREHPPPAPRRPPAAGLRARPPAAEPPPPAPECSSTSPRFRRTRCGNLGV